MARNLHKAGLLTGVWNRTRSKSEALAEETGCLAAGSIKELGTQLDACVICVSADADVLEVVDKLRDSLQAGTLVIDCSTVSAATAREAAARLAEKNIDFVDCPVSGGTEGAHKATLSIMGGGNPDDFARAMPVRCSCRQCRSRSAGHDLQEPERYRWRPREPP